MKNRSMYGMALAGSALALGLSANAGLISSYDSSAPSSNVITSHDSSTGGYQWRNNGSRRDLGQSFLISSDTVMDSFSLKLAGNIQAGASAAAITAKVFESSDRTLIGNLVSTQNGNFLSDALNPVNPGWVTFDLDNQNLTAGNYYTVMLSFDVADVAHQDQILSVENPGSYADGYTWESSDGVSYSRTSFDLPFSVQTIPEPATLGLISLACVLLVAGRRHLFSF